MECLAQLAIEIYLTGTRGMNPAKNSDQRCLAGTIVTNQTNQFAGVEIDRDILERVETSEVKIHVLDLNERMDGCHCRVSLSNAVPDPAGELLVEDHRYDQNGPDEGDEPRGWRAERDQLITKAYNDQGTENGADERAAATCEQAAADDGRRDSVEFHELAQCHMGLGLIA